MKPQPQIIRLKPSTSIRASARAAALFQFLVMVGTIFGTIAVIAGPSMALPMEYTVKKGDSLISICQQYYGNSKYWPELQLYNGIKNANLIMPGDLLEVPVRSVIHTMYTAYTREQKIAIMEKARKNGGYMPGDPNAPSADERDRDSGPAPPEEEPKNPRKIKYKTMECIDNDI